MGVPKFFRWCAERYPSIITSFKEHPPLVDNFYIDFNGIIHNCTHSNDVDPMLKSPSEKKMIQLMFVYLEKLFVAVQPRKCFFIAVDGVAPRAKMNQQRQRRYRSAYERMVARAEAIEEGRDVPNEEYIFDSNCITPGTPFMVRVSEALCFFIATKLSTDPAWQSCKVIFSGHDNPGEGEHKIMDFIRGRKMQPGYNSNETHYMYGLDADLIMLALSTHEPHFVLLREVVEFGGKSRKEREREEEDAAKGICLDKSYNREDEFVLLHINVLRDYLQMDISVKLSPFAKCTFDLERVIDDFVFMLFFVGNDFLPSIPTVGIHDQGVLKMLDLYTEHVLSKNLFLIHNGSINWHAVEIFLSKLGELEFKAIKERQAGEAEYHSNRSRRDPSYEVPTCANTAFTSIEEYKESFYQNKHKIFDEKGMESLKQHYVEGLSWVFSYYYQGVPSWKWFYPHYYAPMASDLVNLAAIGAKVSFEFGKPFLPHQQLLAVLPPMSYRSIPKAYWPLLKSSSSPLASFYPEHITIDREGTRAEWEGIVLIPFIDEKILLSAYESVQSQVDREDANNNKLGPSICFSFDPTITPYDLKSNLFSPLRSIFVKKEAYEFPPYRRFEPNLCKGVCIGDKELEGFSSLQSKIKLITPTYESGVVDIFKRISKEQSLILNLKNFTSSKTAEEEATLIGKEVLVGFPHYKRARIASLSDARVTLTALYNRDGSFSGVEKREKNRDESLLFLKEAEAHRRYMKLKLGISVDEVPVLVYVNRFFGMRVSNKGYLTRQFSSSETCYPLPLICLLSDIKMVEDTRYMERERTDVDSTQGDSCVYIGPEPKSKDTASVFGSCGQILSTESNSNAFTISLKVPRNPFTLPSSLSEFASPKNWVALQVAADKLGISSRTLTTICSSIVTVPQFGSRELGLCIKFSGRGLARVGYARLLQRNVKPWYVSNIDIFSRIEQDENVGHHLEKVEKGEYVGKHAGNGYGTWYLSQGAMKLLKDYINYFSPLVDLLEKGISSHHIDPPQFLTGKWEECDADDILDEITSFLDDTGIKKVPMVTATDDAFPPALLEELETSLEHHETQKTKMLTLRHVPKNYLYFPITRSIGGHLIPIPLPREQTFRLGARVVNCRVTGMVPFGARGTVVRLLASGRDAEVVYDIPFTSGVRFHGRLKDYRGAITKLSALLVLKNVAEDGPRSSVTLPVVKDVLQTPHSGLSEANTNEIKAETGTDSLFVPKPRSAIATASVATSTKIETICASNLSPETINVNSQGPTGFPSNTVSFTSSSPTGGIKLRELVSCLPTLSSPSSNIKAAAAGTGDFVKPFTPISHKFVSQEALRENGSQKQEQKSDETSSFGNRNTGHAQKTNMDATLSSKITEWKAIPEEFVSGKIRITCKESGSVFKKWLSTFLEAEIKNA
ncbi:unnamed protein product [Phytomonas sp. EM1]|nr:unnamed protein product [Phytomonas sp. EM1]|eukprot:CCW61124.1 unnamed protein product [Phytomonas sp. isolate EM1]